MVFRSFQQLSTLLKSCEQKRQRFSSSPLRYSQTTGHVSMVSSIELLHVSHHMLPFLTSGSRPPGCRPGSCHHPPTAPCSPPPAPMPRRPPPGGFTHNTLATSSMTRGRQEQGRHDAAAHVGLRRLLLLDGRHVPCMHGPSSVRPATKGLASIPIPPHSGGTSSSRSACAVTQPAHHALVSDLLPTDDAARGRHNVRTFIGMVVVGLARFLEDSAASRLLLPRTGCRSFGLALHGSQSGPWESNGAGKQSVAQRLTHPPALLH